MLTHQVRVRRLFEQQFGDISQCEGDEGGCQNHRSQVVFYGVSEQFAAHLI